MNVTSIGAPICNAALQLPNITALGVHFARSFSVIMPPLSRLMNNNLGANGTSLFWSAAIFTNATLTACQRAYVAIQMYNKGDLRSAATFSGFALGWTAAAIYEAVAVARRYC